MTISPSEVSMGFNSENAHISPIVVDIETWPLENAADYLEPVQAARNLRDPEKIKADIEQKTAERQDKLALDCNVGRIAAIGWWTEESGINADVCKCEGDEATMLAAFWLQSKRRDIIGFNIKGFDLRYLIQRSRYLGVKHPAIDMGKYSKRGVTDLFLELTFYDGHYDQGAMRRTLKAFCKRFGIPVDDDISGKEIPALAAAGKWDEIEAHVRSDVALTVELARKLGLVNQDLSAGALTPNEVRA
jgi:DNA polymerase elongation subunit (family B)